MDESKKTKLLIVDDNDVIRETYTQVFKQKNFEVIDAIDGLDGADKALKEMPDVILTGIIMPRMDGFQLIQTLRENTQTREIPIAILSHLGREEDRQKALQMGITEFIVQGSATANEIVDKIRSMTKTVTAYKLNFDAFAWDAPRLAENLPGKNLNCPNCQEKVILEIRPKADEAGFDAFLKCPKCDYILR